MTLDLAFVHFRSIGLSHLDAAWYSLSRQSFAGVDRVVFLDNNAEQTTDEIISVLDRYPLPVSLSYISAKHGDPTRTHSWSVNYLVRDLCTESHVFFTRSDYILAFDAVQRMRHELLAHPTTRLFVSGWCWQMAYDREARNVDAVVDIEQYAWRHHGMSALLRHPYAFNFFETHLDAGVWCTERAAMAEAGWMNEGMVSWGYQQSEFQRRLTNKAGVTCRTIPAYLFAHQHHMADRDFARAQREWVTHSGQ